MSAADAGRKNIEDRLVGFVTVGDNVLDPNGREYHVVSLGASTSMAVVLNLQPKGQCGHRPMAFARDETVRVRR